MQKRKEYGNIVNGDEKLPFIDASVAQLVEQRIRNVLHSPQKQVARNDLL